MRASGASCPEVVFVSPYLRTLETLRLLKEEWPEPARQGSIARGEDRGLALLDNGGRIDHVMQPKQGKLHDLPGEFDYRFLHSEDFPEVRQRTHSQIATLTREFAGKCIMAITHHLTILATRANFEWLSPEQFLHLDEPEKPVNCGVTRYPGKALDGNRSRFRMA
jgi:broad specificity phosphatase PhoE